jgi:hypothetical protein
MEQPETEKSQIIRAVKFLDQSLLLTAQLTIGLGLYIVIFENTASTQGYDAQDT